MALTSQTVKQTLPIVYHNLGQVIKTLTEPQLRKRGEVKQLLKIGYENGILDSTLQPVIKPISVLKPKLPFLVIEGLDGSGKTKVSTSLSEQLDLELKGTPPEIIKHLKEFFDQQGESIRRAYYSFGNYLVANDISSHSSTNLKKGVVLDRYWHSTAAYAIAHELTNLDKCDITRSDYNWPGDLLKPDMVIFLVVSEEVRRYRHAYRNTTNTKEEQLLATNGIFRQNLIDSYNQIKDVNFLQFSADDDIEIVKANVYNKVVELFPILLEKLKKK